MADKPGDTPEPEKKPETPGAGADTPPKKEGSDSPDDLKNEVEREKARAATALSEKAEAEKTARVEKIGRIKAEKEVARLRAASGGDGGTPDPKAEVNTAEEEKVMQEAEKGIMSLLAFAPQYNAVLNVDPTLKMILQNNPLSLIKEYIDAEDAVDQIKKILDSRLIPADPAKPDPVKKEIKPPAGQVEMKGTITPEQARKMTTAEWAALPKETQDRLKRGEF